MTENSVRQRGLYFRRDNLFSLPTILQKKRPGITGFISNNQTLRTAGKNGKTKAVEINAKCIMFLIAFMLDLFLICKLLMQG